ncbi:MAG: hypothetical protein E7675_07400 [Ruminococcaceae bacterium]|nr:hypothetical protein [Oscillospiraceae bacterium]
MKKLKFISVFAAVVFMTLILAISSSAATGLSDSTIYVGATTTASVDVLSGTASVTWSCIPSGIVSFENNSLGSYSCTVNVRGNLPGNATIRAVVTDAYGNTSTTTVGTITVVLEDGIYRIRNNYTDQNFTGGTYYLRAQQDASSSSLMLAQHSQNNFGDVINKIYNNWRIVHLGGGEYVFRSFAKENQVLNYTGTAVSIETISSTVPDSAKWIIEGYNIKPKNNTTKCLGLASTSPSGTIYEGSLVYNYFNLQVGMIGDMAFEKWTFSDDVAISELGLTDNAKYYIMNANSKRYMSLASTTEATSIAICTLAKSTENYYQWTVQKQNDSKYQLINNIGSATKVMTVFGTSLYTFNDTNSSNQMFVIYRNDEPGDYQGLYFIKYGQYYVAENSSHNVYLTTTPTTDALWSFMAVDKGSTSMYYFKYSLTDTGYKISKYTTVFTNLGYNSGLYKNFSASDGFNSLKVDDIFVFSGHGNAGLLAFKDDNGNHNGYILADSGMNRPQESLFYANNINENGLSNARCVLLMGCYTGVDTTIGGYNLVDKIYDRGAHFVLGMTEEMTDSAMNNFYLEFLARIEEGKSIEEVFSSIENRNIHFPVKRGEDTVILYELPAYYLGDVIQNFE